MVDGRGQAFPNIRSFPVPDRVDQQIAQGFSVEMQPSEYVEHLPAEGFPRVVQFLEQGAVHIAFPRVGGDQIPQMAHLRLADSVDASEALFQPVGIPGQVVIDHQVRALQVDSLSGCVRREQHLHVRVMPEGFLRFEAFFAFLAAVDDGNGPFPAEQRGDTSPEIMQRVEVLGENDDLLSGRCRFGFFDILFSVPVAPLRRPADPDLLQQTG